jgi:hypothetical protein
MKRRHIVFLLALGLLAGHASIGTASAADFTCQVYGGSFVLDDSDFEALGPKKMTAARGITREQFAALPLGSKERAAICDTRKLLRVIKAGMAHQCDFVKHYPLHSIGYASASEVHDLNEAAYQANQEPVQQCR